MLGVVDTYVPASVKRSRIAWENWICIVDALIFIWTKLKKKLFKSTKNYTVLHCSYSNFVQIRLNNSASSIAQVQISHLFLLLLTLLPSLGAEWIVEWKEFSSKVPVCRATPCLAAAARPAAPPPTYFEWRDVWNFVWIAVKWEIWVLTRKAFTRFAYAPRRLRAAFSRQLKSSFPLLTQKEFGEGDNFPKRVESSHGG